MPGRSAPPPTVGQPEAGRLPSQLIHGDLLGNVLFADDEPPTIIDWAAYFRPDASARPAELSTEDSVQFRRAATLVISMG